MFNEVLIKLRKNLNKKQSEVANSLNISRSAYASYEQGTRTPDPQTLIRLSKYFNVSVDTLLDCEDLPSNLQKTEVFSLPIIGTIHAGYDGLAVEDFTGEYQEIPLSILKGHTIQDFMVLRVSGDSMYPQFYEGDRVLVERKDFVDNGDIAVVLYNGNEATIKQVRYIKGEDWLELIPRNTSYPPRRIEGSELQNCRVLGKVVYLFRKI